jgi:predicted N-formylglutamate amidohydrolase
MESYSQPNVEQYINGTIYDCRESSSPLNKIMLTCEHATNELPPEYQWSKNDENNFLRTHWAYDIGAIELAKAVAEELKIMLVHTNYSRLIIDTNRPIASDTLFRLQGDGKTVELNKELSPDEERTRIEKHYFSYYWMLRKADKAVDPEYIFSIHSFNRVYEGEQRDVEVGALTSLTDEPAPKFVEHFNAAGIKAAENQPYSGKDGLNYTLDALIISKQPISRKGVLLEFGNDILTDPARFKEVKDAFVQFLKQLVRSE